MFGKSVQDIGQAITNKARERRHARERLACPWFLGDAVAWYDGNEKRSGYVARISPTGRVVTVRVHRGYGEQVKFTRRKSPTGGPGWYRDATPLRKATGCKHQLDAPCSACKPKPAPRLPVPDAPIVDDAECTSCGGRYTSGEPGAHETEPLCGGCNATERAAFFAGWAFIEGRGIMPRDPSSSWYDGAMIRSRIAYAGRAHTRTAEAYQQRSDLLVTLSRRVYVARMMLPGGGSWGAATTKERAIRIARKTAPRPGGRLMVLRLQDGAWGVSVDDVGQVVYNVEPGDDFERAVVVEGGQL